MHINSEQGIKGQREMAEIGPAVSRLCGYVKIGSQLQTSTEENACPYTSHIHIHTFRHTHTDSVLFAH